MNNNNNSKNPKSAPVNLLNEKLKAKEREMQEIADDNEPMKLDDAARVKVLSPARLVAKRFFRNKLAMVGLIILITLFVLCFLGPFMYPYKQTEKFSTVKKLNREYAICGELSSFTRYVLDKEGTMEVANYIDSFVKEMTTEGVDAKTFKRGKLTFEVKKLGDRLYMLYVLGRKIGSVDLISGTPKAEGLSDEAVAAISAAVKSRTDTVVVDGVEYTVDRVTKTAGTLYATYPVEQATEGLLASKFSFDKHNEGTPISQEFEIAALRALYDSKSFEYDGKTYTIDDSGDEILIKTEAGEAMYGINEYSIRDYSGQDSFDIAFKATLAGVVNDMVEAGAREGSFVYEVAQLDPDTGERLLDDDGNVILGEETLNIQRKEVAGEIRYYAYYDQITEVFAMYESPSAKHILGTDGDGYDVMSRIMYGGRISLMVGFVVVILETILGVIMGGIAGFFGGWVDTLIMRLVDIFYCIPTMPIMIIIASMFDKMQMPTYERLIWMMAILGILGWSGIARLVRGQILSLREQEFMTAAEATGLKTSRRIFKHLVPNVMPQLIVSMTMGLGSVILLESTLSYLGLGVKHPLATWGNIINSVSDIEAMKSYTYIWIPVGVLICLAVIAFNFVGDGLRDAFDPKMKR